MKLNLEAMTSTVLRVVGVSSWLVVFKGSGVLGLMIRGGCLPACYSALGLAVVVDLLAMFVHRRENTSSPITN